MLHILYVHYSTDSTKLDIRHPAHFDHQGAQVWRVAWNVTGTILASSGDDGCVRLWKGVYTCTYILCHTGVTHVYMEVHTVTVFVTV